MAAKERAIRRPKLAFGRRRTIRLLSLLPAFATVFTATALEAQQPLRRPAPWSGAVTPPVSIRGLDDLRPFLPLELSRAWLAKVESVRIRRDDLEARGLLDGVAPEDLVRMGAALGGTLRIPIIPVHYADVQVPFTGAALQDWLFGPGRGDTVSFRDYWSEVSGGLLTVEGQVSPWVPLKKPARHYLPPEQHGWSSFGRIAELREEALVAASSTMDFALFDNDGPDGVPNSGDDDGFVDFVAIVYAVSCPGDGLAGGIWPHRAAMPPFATTSVGVDGQPIRVADYVVLPVMDQATCGPLKIGVLAHETGHALGLPDLYDYDGSSQGIGAWGLMGSGSHSALHSPAHPGAWEKEQLGWVRVNWLTAADTLLSMEPVQASRTVYRVQGSGSDYLLLENRQRVGSDRHIAGTGLLIWHIDPERAELGAWNSDERRAAVGIIEADGRNDLARGQRADAGDPFPGRFNRTALTTELAGGLQLAGIDVDERVLRTSLTLGMHHRAVTVTPEVLRLTALPGGDPVHQRISVRRTSGEPVDWQPVTRASWLRLERDDDDLVITVDPGRLLPGTYNDTVDIRDADNNPLAHVVVSFYIASAGIGEVIATELPWSWGVAVRGGRILQASYGWDQLGLRPRPRVLQIWEGVTHPHTLSRLAADALYSPIVDTRDGATFVLARARDENFLYELRGDGEAHIVAARIGSEPAYGAAMLPDGSIAVAEWSGAISRVTRDGAVQPLMNVGYNIYQIATDAAGNIFAATWSGDVLRIDRAGERTLIATAFGPGRLVAIATTPTGSVLAAERGGQGRILRVDADGTREIIYRRPGARFYGLAVDDSFLFALDLTSRDLLRIPMTAAALLAASSP